MKAPPHTPRSQSWDPFDRITQQASGDIIILIGRRRRRRPLAVVFQRVAKNPFKSHTLLFFSIVLALQTPTLAGQHDSDELDYVLMVGMARANCRLLALESGDRSAIAVALLCALR
jgi:hypothetical protein